MGSIDSALESGRFGEARASLDTQLKLAHSNPQLSALHYLRSVADMGLGDVSAFRADEAVALRLAADEAKLLPFYFQIGTEFDPDSALNALERLAQIDPAAGRTLDEVQMGRLLQRFYQGGRRDEYNRLVLDLAELSYGTILSADEFQKKAAAILIERGENQRAFDHARQVGTRSGLIAMLTDRRYESLWPALQNSAGDRLEIPARARLARTQALFDENPESLARRLDLMRALVDAGELAQASKLGSQVGRTREELLSLNEATAYVVDEHAGILETLGKLDEGDRRRTSLVETWSGSRRWIINMAINRLEAWFDAHRYGDVLRELDRPGNRYEADSSAYAKQLLRCLRIGSLVGVGRPKEASSLIPQLKEHTKDAPSATIAGLLLAGLNGDAEAVALQYLKDPDERASVIGWLSVTDRAPRRDDPLAERVHAEFRKRPAVEAAFQLYARDLPQNLRRTF